MGYKNIEPILIGFSEVPVSCGLFNPDEFSSYLGCRSRSKSKTIPGVCSQEDCPLVRRASLADIRKGCRDEYGILRVEYSREIGRKIPLDQIFPDSEFVVWYRTPYIPQRHQESAG